MYKGVRTPVILHTGTTQELACTGNADGMRCCPFPYVPGVCLSLPKNHLRYRISMGRYSRPLPLFLLTLALTLLLFALSSACMAPGEGGTPAPDPSQTPSPEMPAVNGTPDSQELPVQATVSLPEASITAEAQQQGQFVLRTFTFLSGRDTYTISIPVRESPSSGTGGGEEDDCPMARWKTGKESQVSSYYLEQIFSPEQEKLYTALVGELSRIRRMEGLNDDEYLELITNFIQQIPYDPAAPLCPRTPSAVIRDGKGDCDEKSGLLLGLLSREGYDVALLLFTEEHHATAGIRITSTTTPSFRVFGLQGKNYVYVETTRSTLIGLYQASFATATPVVVPVGNGTLRYRAINDVMYVVGVQRRMEDRMTFLGDTREEHLEEIYRLEVRLTSGSYDTQDEFDADYTRYSRLITEYNQMGKDYTAIQEVYHFLRDHQYDRAGCRARIENSKVELLL